MTTTSARLGIAKPTTGDDFDTAELAANWQKIDDSPGIFIADDAGDLPVSWGAAHSGMFVWQKDESLLWRWNGSAFVRYGPRGSLLRQARTTDLGPITSGSYTTLATGAATVPEGGRNVELIATWGEITGGAARMALFRGASQLMDWKATVDGGGGSVSFTDLAPTPGSQTYSFQVKNTAATTTVECSATSPGLLVAREV